MKRLVIIGASGHGEVCAEIAEQMGIYDSIVFLDDDMNKVKCLNFDVIGKVSDFEKYSDSDFFVAIGDNKIRKDISEKVPNLVTLIHPKAVISNSTVIEKGCVIMANAVINANCYIGEGCIVNTGSSIDHDCKLDSNVHISPGAHIGGSCIIGSGCWVGLGANLVNNISVGMYSVIGAGTVVIKSLGDNVKVAGNPARSLSKN